ncbi:MAG TPA: 3',5'-cyclic-nucleotide phosphodiesterase [Candidatus Methylomirabilis sp.]|nr:3',5'-cyclic-nucleotide phosphodiesterase [Candidatus Methylomirabilis sp.]
MRLHALGCYGGEAPGCHQTSLLVDGRLLLDAGSVTAALPLDSQAAIDQVLVSHSHLDHIAALAFLADNLSTVRTKPIEVWSIPPVIRHLKTHVFNGIIWPDFTTIPSPRNPILSFHEIPEGQPRQVGRYEVMAVPVDHTVEATGYVVSDGVATILFQGDSGPTTELWKVANAISRLQAIIVETSYPNPRQDLADASGHLTPQTLRAELTKLRVDVPIYVQHIKPQFISDVVRELAGLSDPPVAVLEQGKEYSFLAS